MARVRELAASVRTNHLGLASAQWVVTGGPIFEIQLDRLRVCMLSQPITGNFP